MFCFVFSYQRRKGIIIHETSIVVYAQLLTGNRYQLNQNGEVYLEKQWSKQALPFVYQTVVKVNIQVQYLLAHSSLLLWGRQVRGGKSVCSFKTKE